MGVTVKVDTARLQAFAAKLQRTPMEALGTVADQMAAEMVREIDSPPKTGRVYGTHQASAPGEAPANETGELASSIRVQKGAEEVILSAEAPYAPVMEHGGAHVAPRPFFYNTIEAMWPQALGEIAEAVAKAMR